MNLTIICFRLLRNTLYWLCNRVGRQWHQLFHLFFWKQTSSTGPDPDLNKAILYIADTSGFIPTPTISNATSTLDLLPFATPLTQVHPGLSPLQTGIANQLYNLKMLFSGLAENSTPEALILAAIALNILIAIIALFRSGRVRVIQLARHQFQHPMPIVLATVEGDKGEEINEEPQQEEKRTQDVDYGESDAFEKDLVYPPLAQDNVRKHSQEGAQVRPDLQAAGIDLVVSAESSNQLCVKDDAVQHSATKQEEAVLQNDLAEKYTAALVTGEGEVHAPVRKRDEGALDGPAAQCELETHELIVQDITITPTQTITADHAEVLSKSVVERQMDDAQIQERVHAIADLIFTVNTQVQRLTQAAAKLYVGSALPDLERGQALNMMEGTEEAQSKGLAENGEIRVPLPTKRHHKVVQTGERCASGTSSSSGPLRRIDLNIMPTAPALPTKGTLKNVAT